jgi:hypothetical protein
VKTQQKKCDVFTIQAFLAGNLLRVSCNFVADGAKNGQQGEDLLEVEPLVCRVRVMVLRPVWA